MSNLIIQDLSDIAPYVDDKAGTSSTPSAGPSAPVGGSTGDRVTGFVQEYLPVAQKVAARTGVEPHVLLGQWGLETGWGKSVIPGTRNLGNIKQGSSWKGRTVDATDNATGSRDPYRAYDDDDGFANDFADLLERRYRNALNYGDNAAGYFNALKSGGYAEDPGYVNKGISAARMARSAIGSVASAPTGSTVNPDDYARRGAAPQDPGVVGDIKDSALALGAGVVRGAGMLAGAFGADNDLAQGASDLADGLMDKQSEARKAQRANRAEIIRQAEEGGSTWEEIKANIGAFAEAPIETSLGAIGTSAPTILVSLIPGLGQATAARLILQGAVSAAQGAGSVKGSIYEAVERKMIESGHDADTAAKVAAGAQAYDGVNGGQIALGAALGVAAGTTGIERSVAGMMGAAAPGKKLGVLSRALLGAAKEAPTEGAQGGQERFAANQALINQGFDVDPWSGVAGQAAGEAVAAAGPGGVFGALDTSKPAAPAPAPAAAPGQTPGPAVQQSPAGTPPGGAGAAPTQPAASVDKVGARASEIEQQVRAEGLLEKLRSIGQPGRTTGEFLDALAVAKNPNIDPAVRQEALESLEMALGWIRDGAMPNDPATGKPFSTELSVQPVPRDPGTDLAPRDDAPVAPAGMGQFFDPNVVDVDAVRVDNMIGGPRAIDPPRARLAAPDDAELDVGVEQTPVADDQPAADAAVEAPAPAGLDGRVGAPSGAETAARRLVDLPKVAVPAGAEPAVQRREAAQIKAAVEAGFDTVERRDDGVYLVHSGRNQESRLSGLGAMVRARKIIADTMAARANEAASSPLNDLEQPTEAQAKAGNYRKGAARLNGFAISIENPRDSVRSGTSPDGKKWESRMAHHYGYIKGSVGADGDQVDVFIGPRPDLDTVFVVDQVDPATGEFDEHKVMMGFKSLEDARAGYLANYEPGWKGMASITEMPLSTFRRWVRSPAAKLPASQYDPRSSNGEQDGQQSDDRAGGPGLGEELRRQDGVGQGLGEVDGEGGGEARQRQDAAVSGGSGRAAAQQGDRDPRPAGRDQASDAVAIEALAAAVERDGRQVKIETVDPSDPRAQAASDLFNAFERLTGHRVIPVVVTGPDAFDGVQLGENTFVNIDGLEQSLAWTVGHEFKHLSDRLPGLAKLYDRIWDLIPTSARAKYLPYLHQTRQVSTNQLSLATPADLAKLKDEMVADFMGQRFNDKAWLQQLAQQKPALFGNFVRDWVKVLNSLIGELQVLLGIRGGRGAAGKDIDAMLSGYIEQLEEAKAIAIEVAAVWAERNPKLAQAAGIGARTSDPKFSARDEFPSLDPDFLDGELEAMLQEELEAELAGGNGEVGMPDEASIKAAGLMAEDAFPALYWQDEDREGIRETVRIPDLYREGKTAVIDVEQMGQDGLWGAQMQTTWVGPGAGEREGYVSIDDAKDFVHRQVAAVMLRRSGYDLLQAAPKAPVRRVVAGWRAIGEIRDDGLRSVRHYRRPTSKTASLKDLAAEMGLDKDYDVVVNVDTPFPGETVYNIGFNSKTSDKRYGALLTIISNGSKKHMSVNTIELARSGMGGAVYQLVSEFAARRGIPLTPESSISGVNTYRRTEQMISAALRTGKSNVMVPHETQRVYGFNDSASTQEQHDDNMGRLILASLRNAVELAPEVMDLRYHPHTGVFTMEDGSDAERLVAEILSRTETRAFGLGRAQLARAAMTREMMSGKLKAEKIESFAAPVLYSARETAAAEYQAVVDQHMGKATWMKAPNGQPTKLTERQWVQVRTPSFKRWFGDWEAFALRDGGVWSDGEGAVSKAVHPETGEPLVIYHGTDKGGFFEFNTPSGERRGNLGIFTTDDYDMARSYVRRGRVQDFTPPTSQDELEEAGFQFEQGYILAGNDIGFFESMEDLLEEYELDPGEEIVEAWKVIDVDGYALDGLREHQFLFPSKESAIAAAAESFSGTDSVAMVYAGFINLRSPHESDFEGALFNGSRDHQWVVEVGGEIQSDSDGKQYFSDKDEAAEFAKMFVAEDDDGADPYDYVRAADEHYETTDGVVREARSIGADGAIIRQVIDDGGGPGGYAMDPRDVFVALKPGQIKSAEWNTGEFGDVDDLRYSKRVQDPADGDRTDVSKLPAGKPVPASLAVGSLEQALQVARSGKYAKGRDLKVDLQRRVLEASSAAGIDLTERTQETHKFLAGMVRRDAEFALKDNQNAVGWYDSKVSRALGALATLHPEIDSDPKARLAFLWALATTSNGLKVNKNFELAEAAYQGWKSTGRMPDNIGIGNAAQQINRGLAAFNSLSDKLGAERLAKFMSTEFGAGEIERMLGVPVGGEWKSTPVRGAAILGPKIGNGFFSNLNGYFGALTMDRWLMRTWGRMTGTLIEVDQKMVKASRTRLADRIAAMDDAQRRLMTQLVRAPIKRRMTIAELDAAAGSTAVATMKVNIREQMMANPKTDEFRRAALNHQVQIDGQKEIPAGPGERNWIRAVFHKALGDLNEAGISMTMSDLQALLWYPERRLYDTAKAADEVDQGYSDDEAPDYANAAMALALANGVDLKDVMAAMDRAEKRGTVRGEQLTEAERAAMLKEFRSAPKQPVQMAFEVAPDPADNAATDAWGQLTTKERTQITSSVRDDVLSDIAALVGVPLQKVAPATGGYMGLVNPSLIAEYQKTKVSLEQARALASAIGYVLDQDSVALMDPRVESKAGLIRITFSGKVEPHAHAIYEAIHAAVPEVDAFTARGNNFDILNFTGMSNEDLNDLVVDALAAIDIPLEGVASFGDVHSELVEKGSYENHLQGVRPGSGSEIRTGVDWLRDRARKAVKDGIRQALDARRSRLAAAARLDVGAEGPGAAGGARQRGSGAAGNQGGRGNPRLSARGALAAPEPADAQEGLSQRLAPLPGAPSVAGFHGPDPRLVEVAEAYARSIGIALRRQSEYVQVDEDRARRIAQAYEAMEHAPQDPAVKEAYQNLIRQTRAQYDALVAAGYRFWFTDLSVPSNVEYLSTPWNAMRDIRANQAMGVFPTEEGFGSSEEFDPANNPLLEDTGLTWPNGGLDGAPKRVLANDLFRAVHDAFGHGLEGAGFRAQGEENAWQAHARLFTGSALGAITSETRGQNSFLNYTAIPLWEIVGEHRARLLYDEGYEGRKEGSESGSLSGNNVSDGEGLPGLQQVERNDVPLLQREESELSALRWQGGNGGAGAADPSGVSGLGGPTADAGSPAGSDRQQWQLRAGESSLGNPYGESQKPTSLKNPDTQRQDSSNVGLGGGDGRVGSGSMDQTRQVQVDRRGGPGDASRQGGAPLWKTITVGEHNRRAKVEDTIFADQKTGLMPSWTWTEGRAGDAPDGNARFSARTDTPEFKRWFGDSKVVDNSFANLLSKPDGVGILLRDLLAAQNASGSGLNPVQALMLALAKNDKIGRGIVGLVPVDVVNSFTKDGFRPEDGGGNTSMFVNALNTPVSDQVLSTFRGILTSLSAKLANTIATGRDQEVGPALLASDFNLREMGALLSLQGRADFWGGDAGVESVGASKAAKSSSASLRPPTENLKLSPAALADLLNKFVSFAPHSKSSISDDLPSSKYIAEQGKPLVVYHGTSADFDSFNPENVGDNFGLDKEGFFFTGSTIEASGYADPKSQFLAAGMSDDRKQDPRAGSNVMPVYLSMQNPLTLEAYTEAFYTNPKVEIDERGVGLIDYFDDNRSSIMQFAKDGGHDGVLFRHKGKLLAAVFRPEQIKSAIGNSGAFDPENPDIRFSARHKEFTIEVSGNGETAVAKVGSRIVGRADAWLDSRDKFVIMNTEVREKYRRRGIATAMYSAIEQATGKRLEPAVSLSDDAFELWKSFRPEAVAGDLRHIKDRLVGRKVVKRGLAGKIKDASGRGATMVYDDHPQGPGTTSVLVGRDEINAALEAAGEAPVVPDGMAVRFSIRNGTSAWDAPEPSRFDDFVYKAQDKLIDLKRVIQSIKAATGAIADDINAYLSEELFHGRAAKRVQDFGTQELTPLMERLAADGLTIGDIEEFLHARHAKEANRVIADRNPGVPELQDGGSGMEDAEVDAYFASLPAAQRTKLEAAAAMVDAINDRTRQLYVSYGLESQETVDAWKGMFKHYVPLQREDKDGGGMGIGQGFSVKGKETKGRTGSKRKVVDILANIAMQRERLIVRGEKNRVAKALIGLARANPNPDFWEVRSQAPTERVYDAKSGKVVDRPDPMFKQRPNVLVAKVHDSKGNVVEQAIVFNEDDARGMRLAQAMKNLDAGNLEGVLGISAKITRYFSAINTQYNPVFGVVNLVRDVQGAMLNLGDTPLAGKRTRIARDTLSALRGIYGDLRAERRGGQASSQWAKLWEEFQEAGGKTGYRELFRTSKDRAEALQEILTPDAWADGKLGKIFTANGTLKVPMSQAKKGADWIFSWLSDYNEAMENGVRLAAYKAALDQGMSQRQAASLAKNLTVNFNRRGQVGMQAGAVYAFFNAAMQGSARIGQTLFDMDGGNLKTLRLSRTGKQVIYGGVLLGSLQALMLAAAGFDDEDPPEFARERSLIIPIGDKKYISIPMPLGFHVIPGVGRHLTEFALGGFSKPAHRLVSMTGMFADAFNPIGNAGLSMQTIAPTALDPLVALTENRDWTGKPISRTSMNPATPGHALHKDTASTIAKLASEAINAATGGNEYVAGVMSPTPDQIDYLIGQVTGGVGRELSKLEQTALGAIRGETVPTFKVPLVGRFVGDAASQASEGTAFYANVAKLNELETEIKGLQGDGRVAEAQQLRAGRPDAYLIAVANTAERQVQRLRREKRALIEEGAPRERVKEVEARITQAMARLNRAAEAVKP